MHRILVEEKRWLGERRFLHALNYCMLLPGPEAQQLAIYIGWLMHRTVGGLIAGLLFVLPGFMAIMALSILYALFGKLGSVTALVVTQFVGFLGASRAQTGLSPLTAAILGGLLTTWVTFTPCFLWIFLGAPFVEALREAKALNAALAAIGAAVVGVILNVAIWFALHVLFRQMLEVSGGGAALEVPVLSSMNLPSAMLTLAAAIAAFRFKVGMIPLLLACAAAGLLYYLLTGRPGMH
jgi:hypothetical protein